MSVLTACANAQTKIPAIDERMSAFIAQKEIAGAVTLVADRERVLHVSAVGQADVAANRAMQVDDIMWIASMSKPITATALMMLQDDGKLSIDDPISKYIPEFANLKTPSGKPANLTLRHCMTHTSGLGEASGEQSKAAKTLADLIPAFLANPMSFEPGAKWQYCQSGINTAARVAEIASGQSFPELLQTRLFTPLGMKDTTFYLSEEQAKRLAKSYKMANGPLEEVPVFILDGKPATSRDRYPAANGGLFSTAADYARFCQMILSGGQLDGRRYLKPETVKLMTTIQTGDIKTGFTEGNGWGIGWCVVRQPQGVTAMVSPGTHGHGGAYGTQAWIDPVKGRIYILMVQRANFPNADNSDVRKAFQQAAVEALQK
ncbi:MAG: serine hydrolase domain-containing protein [Tepidisphaerales bacterium]